MTAISVPIYQAEEFIQTHFPMSDAESIPVLDALGRVLRSPLYKPLPEPPPAEDANGEPQAIPQQNPEILIECGVTLAAHHLAAAHQSGIETVHVSQCPRVWIQACGAESPARTAAMLAVKALCARHGFILTSDETAENIQVCIRIGGGPDDRHHNENWLVNSLAAIPGKAFGFGCAPEGTPIFALPAVPLTAMILTCRLVIPQILTSLQAAIDQPPVISVNRSLRLGRPETLFQPVRVQTDYHGERTAEPLRMKDLNDPTLLAQADGFVEMTDHVDYYAAGDLIPFYRW